MRALLQAAGILGSSGCAFPSGDAACGEIARRAGLDLDHVECTPEGICANIVRLPGIAIDIQLAESVNADGAVPVSCADASEWVISDRRFKRRHRDHDDLTLLYRNDLSLEATDPLEDLERIPISALVRVHANRFEDIIPAPWEMRPPGLGDLLRDTINPLVASYPFIEHIDEALASLDKGMQILREQQPVLGIELEELEAGIGLMLATIENDPDNGPSRFAVATIHLLESIYEEVGAMDLSVQTMFPGWSGFSRSPFVPPPSGTMRLHDSVKCGICEAASTGVDMPSGLDALGDLIMHSEENDVNLRGRHWTRYLDLLSEHVFVPSSRACSVHGNFILELADAIMRTAWTPRRQALTRKRLLQFVRACDGLMNPDLVAQYVPRILQRTLSSFRWTPSALSVHVDQELNAYQRLESIFHQMAFFTKTRLMHDGFTVINIQYRHSSATGDGTGKQLIDIVATSVVDDSVGMFLSTSHGTVHPNPSSRQLRDFHSLGQLAGLAHSMGVVFGLPLGSSALWLIKCFTGKRLDLDTVLAHVPEQTLLDNFKADFPDKYSFIMEKNISALIGTEFNTKPRRILTDNSPETRMAYLVDQAKYDTIISIFPQVKAMVAGIYDLVPFPLLSFYDMAHLEEVFGAGETLIDPTELRQSTSYVRLTTRFGAIESDVVSEALAMPDPVIRWFWEIIQNELDAKQLSGFLNFVSGNRYPPLGGFRGINRDKTWLRITYNQEGLDMLPVARTCFRGLYLGSYSSKEIMKARILSVTEYNLMDAQDEQAAWQII